MSQVHTHAAPHVHEHEHGHEHGEHHAHAPSAEPEAGRPPQGGPVALDIGGDVGALIARMDDKLLGTELHVRRDGDAHTTHTGVWERHIGNRSVVVAVFAELVEGSYAILDDRAQITRTVVVDGGRVAEIDLRSA